ncbi:site-2 protease family protein [Candidatus Peregrinibacteria bacterium]|nr:site-2 protease family protein [Candidatus Peregrinibacteria bacterium]
MLNLVQIFFFIVALLVTLTVHEASHALAAYYLGDPTAKNRGRLTLNPIAHLDLLGTLVFIVTQRIGWGKPVPVNPANFKNPIRDNALTSLAGPMSNFILAFSVSLPLKYLSAYMHDYLSLALWMIFDVSVFLGIFNLLPIPPLDGSKILGLILPRRLHLRYDHYLSEGGKYFVAIILIDVFILRSLVGFSFLAYILSFLHEWVSVILLLGS